MTKCHKGKVYGVISAYQRRVHCNQRGERLFFAASTAEQTFELSGSRHMWKDGKEERRNLSGTRSSMYRRRGIRVLLSEQAGIAGEWAEALLGRGGI